MTLQGVQTMCMLSLKHTATMSYVCSQNENSLGIEISVITLNQILSFLNDMYGL